jgi:hypothetical protein
MLPDTTTRVQRNTPQDINRRIEYETEDRIRHFAANPHHIDRRLRELDAEWDMERTLETNAAGIALLGTVLSAMNRRFLLLPALVTGFLMQHALQGWCPPVPFFRRRGVRTTTEIERERYALKALRGDFQAVDRNADSERAAATALRAVRA